jgi:hypothetical protein
MFPDLNEISGLFDEFYLVNEPVAKQPVKRTEIIEQTNAELRFIGSASSRILFIFEEASAALSAESEALLEGLVTKGLQRNMNEVVLFNLLQNPGVDFKRIRESFRPAHIVFWGCDAFVKAQGLPQETDTVIRGKEARLLRVKPFGIYIEQTALKKKLWENLKALFEIA